MTRASKAKDAEVKAEAARQVIRDRDKAAENRRIQRRATDKVRRDRKQAEDESSAKS